MPKHLTNNPAAPLKKTWVKPELIFISHNDVTTVKQHPSVHEHTGHTWLTASGTRFFVNSHKHGFALTTMHGGVIGHKSSAS